METSGRTASDASAWMRSATTRSAPYAPSRSATTSSPRSSTSTKTSRRTAADPDSAEQDPAGDVRRRTRQDDGEEHAEWRQRSDRPLLVRRSGAEYGVDREVGEQRDQCCDDGH